MSKLRETTLLIIGGLAAFILLAFILIEYVFSDWGLCENSVYEELASPNNLHRAVVFERNCGATTGFSTQLSILSSNEELMNTPGNVYVVEGQPGFVKLTLHWLDDNHLHIGNSVSAARVAKSEFGAVSVTYD